MTRLCDLHTHSTASDGQYTPTELAALVKKRGAEVWALTDHDTVDGAREAADAGEELGLRVIPGIELSAGEYDTFHILGYGYDLDDPGLAAFCARMKAIRDERSPRIIAYLRENGMPLTLGEVEALAGGAVVGRPHFVRAMVARGYAASNREAFDRWLDTREFHERVERAKPSARECVETVKGAGGKASLAHPYQIGVDDVALEAIVRGLKDYGLDAIECYYPKHTPAQQAFYLRLAEKYGLRVTGGSDFHGERVKPDVALAAWELDADWLV